MAWGQLALAGAGLTAGLYIRSLNHAAQSVRAGLNPPLYIREPRCRVSLCVPAYNESAYIRRLLISARNQTEPFAEIVVADSSAPEEGTADIAREYGGLVVPTYYGNVAAARNAAAEASAGDVILFADADMTLSNRLVESVLNVLEQGYACAHPRYLIDDSTPWSLITWPVYAFRTKSLTGGCVAVPRSVWDEIGGYDETCNPGLNWCREDLNFGYRIAMAYGKDALKILPDVVGISARRYYSYWGDKTFNPVRAKYA